MKETVLTEVRKKMEDLLETRHKELAEIHDKVSSLSEEAQELKQAMEEATVKMDIEVYTTASSRLHQVEAGIEMYEKRKKQITGMELISEAKSDAVIDQILEYENEIRQKFEQDTKDLLARLSECKTAYDADWREAEALLSDWTMTIHRNYRSFSTIYPNGTNRADKPVPIRTAPYNGGKTTVLVGQFLKAVKGLDS